MLAEREANAPRSAADNSNAPRSAADNSNAPRSAADNSMDTWLERVEASVENAYAVLLSPQRGSLPQFVNELEWAVSQSSGLAVQPGLGPRLAHLRGRLHLVRSMLRQAAAFEQAREQLKTESVLGYTPTGLERALQ